MTHWESKLKGGVLLFSPDATMAAAEPWGRVSPYVVYIYIYGWIDILYICIKLCGGSRATSSCFIDLDPTGHV